MENNNDKFVSGSFLVAAILAGLVVNVLVETAAAMAPGAAGRFLSGDLATHIVPVVVGMIVFAILMLNPKLKTWGDEVVSEIRKIVWPSQRETMAMTVVVCVMLVFAGLVIGGFDMLSAYTIDALLNLNFSA